MERITYFADVLLPVAVEGYFTYRVPNDQAGSVKPGYRVVVQFGKQKVYTGLVRRVHTTIPVGYTPKYILSVLDPAPLIEESHFVFWEWMAAYYVCTVGEVMNAALPAAFKLASETRIALHPGFNGDYSSLNDKEMLVAEACEIQKQITLADVARIVETVKIIPLIKSLIDKQVVVPEEELNDRYQPKKTTYLSLHPDYRDDDALNRLFDVIEKKAPRQSDALMLFISLTANQPEIARSRLLAAFQAGASAIDSLIKKNILIATERTTSRYGELYAGPLKQVSLSASQEEAYKEISRLHNEKQVVLLHGVTSSGKTEIYIRLIREVLDQEGQVLYLLPEIALTGQIINRLRQYFGDGVAVYHSRHNDKERAEIWNRVSTHPLYGLRKINLVVGARSGLFLPFSNLRLIIVDEEHDTSFRQANPAPRYNARDSAIYLASLTGAKIILGTATPSIESYANAKSGKYGLVQITSRFGEAEMPVIKVADMKAGSGGNPKKSMFTDELLEGIGAALNDRSQVILFQNRRGYAPRLECDKCQWVPVCRNCDISLVYHKNLNQLKCHYCGWSVQIPPACPVCRHTGLQMKSFGTEKVEDELGIFFPQARIARLDLDAIRAKNAHLDIIRRFEERDIDILVGTQMVTKGLDFAHVSLVGVLNADHMLAWPDFRAFERSYQLMAQVSGRAGRSKTRGNVIIQTRNPDHPAIQFVIKHDYEGMFNQQLNERQRYHYPPYSRLILIELKHADAEVVKAAAQAMGKNLRNAWPQNVLGPEQPLVSRIRGLFIRQILIKFARPQSLGPGKEFIRQSITAIHETKEYRQVKIAVHVDPL